nr:GLPGLI family protein [uncultured Flavobacterium sp.]
MKLNLSLLFLLFCNFLFAQKTNFDYKLTYHTTINTHIKEEYENILFLSNYTALFTWKTIGNTQMQTTSDGGFTRAEHKKNREFNFIDTNQKNIISLNNISSTESHYVKQPLPEIKWEITNETKIISDMQCIKAVGVYGGREFVVWFSTEFPTQFGPWKLIGLPGVVVQAYDTYKEIVFDLKSIEKNRETVSLDLKNKKYITLEGYYKREIDYPYELLKRIQSTATRGSSISISNVTYNFLEKDFEYLTKK